MHRIPARDQEASHFRKFACNMATQKHQTEDKDIIVLLIYQKMLKLQSSIQKQSESLNKRHCGVDATTKGCAIKKLRGAGKEFKQLHEDLKSAKSQASGMVQTPDLQNPEALVVDSIPSE
ncbi:hypothetical protein M422DRAFT_267166 [Sphaerobolus stellatus SS14]|uniref:Uncharacterized protein n=1 Tax=Sphaerobolus stellatus (strain SS14) TaxID=990650 RepID=A0A0C9UQ75_SPHS4|nr:hypothetical protein M422DRAFT_267166 [Sphaerobolus stellatus SS14]